MYKFRELILEAQHLLRVDPSDEAARLMLADLISEHGAYGNETIVAQPLREGRIVLANVDVRAADYLRVALRLPVTQFDRLGDFRKLFADYPNSTMWRGPYATMCPMTYGWLWTNMTERPFSASANDAEMRGEIIRIRADRVQRARQVIKQAS